jgi:hypothetical protein
MRIITLLGFHRKNIYQFFYSIATPFNNLSRDLFPDGVIAVKTRRLY